MIRNISRSRAAITALISPGNRGCFPAAGSALSGGHPPGWAHASVQWARCAIDHYKPAPDGRSEEHTSELQSLMRISYAVFCLKKKNNLINNTLHACIYTLTLRTTTHITTPKS